MKKKGFTLIELLAVIVILAIIALIATPLIIKYIDKSNRESLKNSIYSINRTILLSAVEDKSNKEYTSTNELDVKIKDTNIKISYIDGETRYYKVSNENYLLDVKKCATKKYCTIDEIESIENVIIHKNELFTDVEDINPGVLCGDGTKEDLKFEICYIRSIEDLVQLAKNSNGGYGTYHGKTIELVQNLDFKNKKSYADKENADSLMETLTTGTGFPGIGCAVNRTFKGTFDGKDNIIKGLYVNGGGNLGLFGYITSSTIKNINIEDADITGGNNVGTLVGTSKESTIENVNVENIKLVGYRYNGGVIGNAENSKITNINIDNIKITESNLWTGGLIGTSSSSEIINITANNIEVNGGGKAGGIIGTNNSGVAKNIVLNNIKVTGSDDCCGGLVGGNYTSEVENIKMNNIDIYNTGMWAGGLIGTNSGNVKNIIGDSIKAGKSRYSAGLVGQNTEAMISNIKITNVDINAADRIGLLIGSNVNNGGIRNAYAQGNLKASQYIGLITGWCDTCNISTTVVKGNIEGTAVYTGGLVGIIYGKSETEVANISGVYLSGNVVGGKNPTNRSIGNYMTYIPTLNTLVSSSITVNGSIVESNDPTSINGKSLDDMGKISQSEYESLGFEFESTNTNEAYWYFNKNNELDLIIK